MWIIDIDGRSFVVGNAGDTGIDSGGLNSTLGSAAQWRRGKRSVSTDTGVATSNITSHMDEVS